MSTPSDTPTDYPARYNDGLTAVTVAAIARAEPRGLVVAGVDRSEIDCWAWPDVQLAEAPSRDRPARLINRSKPDARLAVDDPAIVAVARTHARYLERNPVTLRGFASIAGFCAIGAAAIAFFVYGLPWVARPVSALLPTAWEEPVGDGTVEFVNRHFAGGRALCRGEAGSAALRTLTGKLRAATDTAYDMQVHVVDSDIVNALAAPGGRIVVFRGLIDQARSAEEVAGVLAHEMAHVAHRHPTQAMIAWIGWSAVLSGFTGGASLSSAAVAELGAHLATSAHSRELEGEADSGAVAILGGSGIGSAGLADFFRSMAEMEKKGLQLPEYLSTHPPASRRIEWLEMHRVATVKPALSGAEWQALKAICR